MRALDQARKRLPYNYELALVLAEIQLVTELMVLACKFVINSVCLPGFSVFYPLRSSSLS